MKRITPSPCPTCGTAHDAVTSSGDEDSLPEPGDVTICAHCGDISMFGEGLKLVPLKAEDLKKYPEETQTMAQRASSRIKSMRMFEQMVIDMRDRSLLNAQEEDD